jgi:hypothetical protein
LVIDEITFVISGLIALATFFLLLPKTAISIDILGGFEALLFLVLGWEVIVYADLEKDR